MSDSTKKRFTLSPEQQAIRDKCFHPSGSFVEFPIADVESSIPRRFEKIVSQFPDQVAIKSEHCKWSYRDLDDAANQTACAISAVTENPTSRIEVLCDTVTFEDAAKQMNSAELEQIFRDVEAMTDEKAGELVSK